MPDLELPRSQEANELPPTRREFIEKIVAGGLITMTVSLVAEVYDQQLNDGKITDALFGASK